MATEKLKIGSILPKFNLIGVDNKQYSNDYFADYKILVVIFSCNHCPYVQAYEERVKAVVDDYKNKGVGLVAINSNDDTGYPEDSFENMKVRAKEKNFNFPYLRDEIQDTAKAFGATHTPEIFVFDSKKELRYHGKMDDNWQEENKVANTYLRDALDELLEGKEISVPETYSIGCTIKWKIK
ncbi:MAG: thioredoxin family protein [Bacteroidetes bacterium]|nr:thioredoxin family protein [Bacteroidota bacterium]MCH8941238.1 thioredoxin family protein [Bacteroidota bacterium]